LPEYSSILNNLVDPGIQSVMSGQKTVEEFLDEWAKAIEESEKKFTSKIVPGTAPSRREKE
jgi:multiple sugar transport system substrate-binding protein